MVKLMIAYGLYLTWTPGKTDLFLHAENKNGPCGAIALSEIQAPTVMEAFYKWAIQFNEKNVLENISPASFEILQKGT